MAASPGHLAHLFVYRHQAALARESIDIDLMLLDDYADKQQSYLRHSLKVARRQAILAGCSTIHSFVKVLFFKAVNAMSDFSINNDTAQATHNIVDIFHVPSLNSDIAINAVVERKCDLVCLMGTRVLTKNTLARLDTPIINIHSSDPHFVRGGPVVFWEILAKKDKLVLTIHEVVRDLDAGHILRQAMLDIRYAGSLGKTIASTMSAAAPVVTDLFRDVILDIHRGRVTKKPGGKGSLKVTPRLRETLRAELICRFHKKYKHYM